MTSPALPTPLCFPHSLRHLTVCVCVCSIATVPLASTCLACNPLFHRFTQTSHCVCVRAPSVSQVHSDISLCVHVQHCNCPPGFNLSCPDNGTAPGCIILPDIPSRTSTLRTIGVVVALLVVALGWACSSTGMMAELCRLCLGAGNPLGERSHKTK